jgi:mono/diheme cytochrome c family protein
VRVTRLTAALSLACSALLLGQGAAGKGDVDKGKTFFTKYGCYQCHGTQGQGTTAGARLAPKPIALAALIAYVRQPKGQMPPYTSKVVSDTELADIRAYLASIPEPPPAKNIPLLNQ